MIVRWLRTLRHRLYLIQVVADSTNRMLVGQEETLRQVAQTHRELLQTQEQLLQTRQELERAQSMIAQTRDDVAQLQHTVDVERNQRGLAQDRLRQVLGRVEMRQINPPRLPEDGLRASEFQVFSQFGEDGILQFLFHHIDVERKLFVEFGVEDYRECNTRFLLYHNRWSGLVMDGSAENIARIQTDWISWWRDLKAVHAFVTTDNINRLLCENGITGEIGLLVIDIDGNDYWIWEAIQVVRPAVVVIEYNYRFGSDISAAVPYDPGFSKTEAHPSAIYYGASLRALCTLAHRKGYAFVGCSSGGVNAFFVRRDKKPEIVKEVGVEEGYVAGQHLEARNESGEVVRIPLAEQRHLLTTLPLVRFDEAGTQKVPEEGSAADGREHADRD